MRSSFCSWLAKPGGATFWPFKKKCTDLRTRSQQELLMQLSVSHSQRKGERLRGEGLREGPESHTWRLQQSWTQDTARPGLPLTSLTSPDGRSGSPSFVGTVLSKCVCSNPSCPAPTTLRPFIPVISSGIVMWPKLTPIQPLLWDFPEMELELEFPFPHGHLSCGLSAQSLRAVFPLLRKQSTRREENILDPSSYYQRAVFLKQS